MIAAIQSDGQVFTFPLDASSDLHEMLDFAITLCKILKLSWPRFDMKQMRECYCQFQHQVLYILWLKEGILVSICSEKTPEGSIRLGINQAMRKI